MFKNRWALLIALVPVVLALSGCAVARDLGDALNGAFYDATGTVSADGIPKALPGDGVGTSVLEVILLIVGGGTPLGIFLTNLIRNRARRRRGEPVKPGEVKPNPTQ